MRLIEGCAIALDARERLRVIYGNRATLAIHTAFDERLSAVIEIPHESD